MNRSQLITHVIFPTLQDMKFHSQEAVDLLVMICAHESLKGEYIHQVKGPAVGIYCMEPATHSDVLKYIEERRPALYMMLDRYTGIAHHSLMAGNLYYATFMARCFFLRIPEAIPTDYKEMAEYAKKYWNTEAGKAIPHDYLHAFNTWGVNKPMGAHEASA